MRLFTDFCCVWQRAVMGCVLVLILVTGFILGMNFTAKTAEAQAGRTFTGDAAIVLNYISSNATQDFEGVMQKVAEALQNSDNAERQQQAQGWKVYRAQEPGQGGSVLYVWIIDPAVAGADYAVSRILSEAFPGEVQQLYEQYDASFTTGSQQPINLDLVVEF